MMLPFDLFLILPYNGFTSTIHISECRPAAQENQAPAQERTSIRAFILLQQPEMNRNIGVLTMDNTAELNTLFISIQRRGVIMQRFNELVELVQSFEKDFEKFYMKGNKSAGTRVRKHMNELKRKAQEIRNEIQEIKKGEDEGDE